MKTKKENELAVYLRGCAVMTEKILAALNGDPLARRRATEDAVVKLREYVSAAMDIVEQEPR